MNSVKQGQGEKALMPLPQFIARYGGSRGLIYGLARRDELPVPVIRLGSRMFVSKAAVDELLAQRKEPANAA